MIIINTKNYKTGDALLKFARLIESYNLHYSIAVPATDIYRLAGKTALNVYAQHVDYLDNEKSTGRVSATSVRAIGGTGTLLNHAEHPLPLSLLKKTIEQCKKAGIMTIVCAKNTAEAQKIATFRPSAIAYENPALIGTKNSVTSQSPKELLTFVKHLKGKPILPLCGSGINTLEDIKKAYELGCKGILIASAIAGTKNPERFLEQLTRWEKRLIS